MAVNSVSSVNPIGFIVPKSKTIQFSLDSGVYDVVYSPASSNLFAVASSINYIFNNGSGVFTVPSSGTVQFQNTNANYDMAVYLIANNSLTKTVTSLTLDTISTTSTYTQTGLAVKMIIIGGGSSGGRAGNNGPNSGGSGGAGGRLLFQTGVALPGNVPVVIGAGGPGGDGAPIAGGASSFGALSSNSQPFVASGGNPGQGFPTTAPQSGLPGSAGTPGESVVVPTGMTALIPGLSPFAGGLAGAGAAGPGGAGLGGGIAAGGGGGGGGITPAPFTGQWRGGTGGGGGGGVPGGNGAAGTGPYNPSTWASYPTPNSGAGGQGRIYILR